MISKTPKIFFQKIKNIFWHLPKSFFYNIYFGQPSKKLILIGVTGTDGKTTTVNLIHQTLLQCGIKAGAISTLGAKIGDRNISVGLHTTSPDPKKVNQIFQAMIEEGITHVVVEVTAHALDQFRFFGCYFQVSVLTNTSHEHLDDFYDLNRYIATKAKLFSQSNITILNKDDPSYNSISKLSLQNVKTYGTHPKNDYLATNIKLTKSKLIFKINNLPVSTNSNYLYQVHNILATFGVIDSLGLPIAALIEIIKDFPAMKGRRENIPNDYKINCLVDFAHTPAALKSTLETIKQITSGKCIVIFGATGGRDPSKRPLMGQVVSETADIAIITADDTRNEKVEDINRQIISGIGQPKNKKFIYYDIPNRQDAFNLAVKLAAKGDTIIACGKGHETTILHGHTEYPWSEAEAFRTALRYRFANNA
ncbi:MAG: UDP-N-acetylmuramoyl-L-alanyl-D-glutamate--2,6-diaminopimelate ligase [Microgenomates group bacterium]